MPPAEDAVAALPDPAGAGSLDEVIERLRMLKVWAGDPSYETIKERVNAAWTAAGRPASELTIRSTVANCFQTGRRRLNTELVLAVVHALHPDAGYVTQWRQALRLIGGESEAVSQVRVQGTLPQAPAAFTGRVRELDQLRRAGDPVVISAIEGMAGVGKTQLAVHAARLLAEEEAFEQVLFVNLRGFHPDPDQPPADPAAVLDGFLRLLGVPGHQIPHDLDARVRRYRDRLAGIRALVVLDNAATPDQVRPLLPDTPGCRALVTSRRSLAELRPATRLTVDVFTPGEALAFLAGAVPDVPVGEDPQAAARIARRCGHLPLALSLIAGRIRSTPGWTLTDHADRLDERHRIRRLDTGVELALSLSYQHLPAELRRLLRLVALHPAPDFDVYAAAAVAGTDLPTVTAWLDHLRLDHLLQQSSPGRYTFHDLVRAFAAGRADDEDPPAVRRAALTRLFDHYLATAATAMSAVHPAEAETRPSVPPADTPAPDLTGPGTALAWLDTERPTLIAVAAHAATGGWPTVPTRLARILSRYLNGGNYADALTMHGHAHHAAGLSGDLAGQAAALTDLGYARMRLGRTAAAAEDLRRALELCRQTGDPAGQARAVYNLGILAESAGRYPEAVDHKRQALELYRRAGDRSGQARTLGGLGVVMERSGRYPEAIGYQEQALTLARQIGSRAGEAVALRGLGEVEVLSGRYAAAGDHLRQALDLYRQLGNRNGEADALDNLGLLHTRLGRFDEATAFHQQALAIFGEVGDQEGETWVLNGLGEAAHAAGRLADARTLLTAARAIAADLGVRDQLARAHAGLGHVHSALGDLAAAREQYRLALALFTELGVPAADEIRARVDGIDVSQ